MTLIKTNKKWCTKECIANEWNGNTEFADQSYIVKYIYNYIFEGSRKIQKKCNKAY